MRTFWTLLLTFVSLRSGEGLQSCPAPPQYQHLNVTLDEMFRGRQWFRSGDKVSYDCAQDFTPIDGSHYVLCTDGLWNKLSLRCRKKSCGRVSDLPNGEFRYEGEPFIGAKVYAVCDKGYKCKGLNYTICQRSGWTGKFPSCVAEGETTCSTPTVANSVQPEVSVHQPGDNLTVTCDQGFQLVGEQLITCGADGQWEPLPPQCLLTPNVTTAPPGSCGMPSKFYNGNAELDEKYITKTFFSSGDKVYYTCPVGYKPAGGSISRRCEDGEWSPLKMTCERRLCGSAGQILNGQFMYSGVQFGDTATAVCDEGYILVGKATRRCRSEGWDGRVPECEGMVSNPSAYD
ncbi:membrane cofactor protein-like [Gouania willdenowi]|uniref:Membrane cofactor protein-like n=1 Tax=Gouania willdenowi TaxID=441366 RepID=A0A8C5I5Z7_GOUWI|nr:membrane cofactor protein-like [Gouania willdenowi]